MQEGLSTARVVRGGAALYTAVVLNGVAGLVFWGLVGRLLGAHGVGVASSLVSAAGVAAVLVSAGLQQAALREAAAAGAPAVSAALLLASLEGAGAAFIAAALAHALDAPGALAAAAALLALAAVTSTAMLFSLIGLEGFGSYTLAQALGSLARIASAALLVPLAGALGALAAFALQYAAAAAVAARRLAAGIARPPRSLLRALAGLQASNYPLVLSNQVAASLTPYLFQLIRGAYQETGGLYIALMVSASIAALPGSLLSAALPIYLRSRGEHGDAPYSEVLRLGLHVAAPLAAAAAAAPSTLLGLLGRGYTQDTAAAMAILAAAVPLTATLQAAVTLYNHRRSHRSLFATGATRLAALLALLPPLATAHGTPGAAAAVAISTAAALLATGEARRLLKATAAPQAALAAATLAAHHTGHTGPAAALLAAAATLAASEATNPGTTRSVIRLATTLRRRS